MAFLDGLKNLHLTDVASGVSSKLALAKEYLHEKQHVVSEMAPIRALREKAQSSQLATYFSPHLWSQHYPNAAGKHQSPIDIRAADLNFDESLAHAKFNFNYVAQDFTLLKNTGTSWQLAAKDGATSSLKVSFRPDDEFLVAQMHAHWGCDAHDGAEHLLAGLGCAMEIHIVHFNAKYGTVREALNHSDGLLVLGIFCDEGLHNESLDPILRLLPRISYKNEEVRMDGGFDLKKVLPESRTNFFVYNGSLTTPPCNECVTWVVFKSSIPVSTAQLDKCRSLHSVPVEDAERNPRKMVRNVRPVQPINDRHIACSYPASH